ncbi:TPA: hypothetical protein ACH3X1_015717 [Trebouxia sp. C0004]
MATADTLQELARSHMDVHAKGKGGNTKFTCNYCCKEYTGSQTRQLAHLIGESGHARSSLQCSTCKITAALDQSTPGENRVRRCAHPVRRVRVRRIRTSATMVLTAPRLQRRALENLDEGMSDLPEHPSGSFGSPFALSKAPDPHLQDQYQHLSRVHTSSDSQRQQQPSFGVNFDTIRQPTHPLPDWRTHSPSAPSGGHGSSDGRIQCFSAGRAPQHFGIQSLSVSADAAGFRFYTAAFKLWATAVRFWGDQLNCRGQLRSA